LSPRIREVALLRVVHRRDCDYLWTHHLPIARRAGLTDAEIDDIRDGRLAAGSIIRLFHSDITFLQVDTAMEIVGPLGVVDDDHELLKVGERYLSRQTVALGGGSDEMARNVIGERVLGLPREYAADRGVPFNEVRHNKTR
jgi:alkylation response protein AidB-like acyl-CoA dehydrogenase